MQQNHIKAAVLCAACMLCCLPVAATPTASPLPLPTLTPPPHTLARRDWQTMTHTSTAGYDKGKTVLKLDNQPNW
jgi:hypothetical protein